MATNTGAQAPSVDRLDTTLKVVGAIGIATAILLILAVASLALPVGAIEGPVVATVLFTMVLGSLAVTVSRRFPARPH